MGIEESIKSAYYRVEDRWYKSLDWLDGHGVPVYALIDPIDAVVPSFILFGVLALLLLVLFLAGAFGGFGLFEPAPVLLVSITDADGNPLAGALVGLTINDDYTEFTTGSNGSIEAQTVERGQRVKLRVNKTGFEPETDEFFIETANTQKAYALAPFAETIRQILLKDNARQPIRSPLALSFACKNPSVAPPANGTTITGLFTVKEPPQCNGLIASVSGDGYESANSVSITENQQVILLTPLEDSRFSETEGSITVDVRANGTLVSETIVTELWRATGLETDLGPLETKATQNGRATFNNVPAGEYVIRTAPTSKYGSGQSDVVSINSARNVTTTIGLLESIKGHVKILLVDSQTKKGIPDAQITLRGGPSDHVQLTNADGHADFPVTVDTTYQLLIDHPNYCFKSAPGYKISESTATVELKKASSECNSELVVAVIDQDNRKIQGAVVGLFTEDGFSSGMAKQITDLNGTAHFKRVPSGTYIAFAAKGYFSAKSLPIEFDSRTGNGTQALIVMQIPDGILRIRARNEDNEPLQFADLTFYNATTNERIGAGSLPIEDINGTRDFVTRADKKVYFTIDYPGLPRFVSKVYDILPTRVTEADVVVEREGRVKASVTLEPRGVYKDGQSVSVVAPGETYKALFWLRIPREKTYSRVGVHLRAGDTENIVEREKIVWRKLNAPLSHAQVKSTSYTPPKGTAADLANVTESESKWINAEWQNPGTGIIELEAEFQVKENTGVDDALEIAYRAWGVQNGAFERDPLDQTLGTAESTANLHALYAKTHKFPLQSGSETLCDERFCFSATLLDIAEDLVQNTSEDFQAEIFKNYRLNLSILNTDTTGTQNFTSAEIMLENEDEILLLQSYALTDAQGNTVSGSVPAGNHATPWLGMGDFKPTTSIQGHLQFTPKDSGDAQITVRIKSNQRIVFERVIPVRVDAAKKFSVLSEPGLLIAGVEQPLQVTLTEESTGLEVEDAIVRLKDKFGTVLDEKRSNQFGVAILNVPAFAPGTKFKLMVEKIGYKVFTKDLTVSAELLEFMPERLGIALNIKQKPEGSDRLKITNKTGFDLVVTGLEFAGDRDGLLNHDRMQSQLNAQVHTKIAAQDYAQLTLVGILSTTGKNIKQSRNAEGFLNLVVDAFEKSYAYEIPVTISIGIGGETDNPTCFSVSKRKWNDYTEGAPVTLEFQLKNNCSVDGIPVSLSDLEVSAEWPNNETGEIVLKGPNSETSVRQGYYTRIANEIPAQDSQTFVLTFKPNGRVNGLAKFALKFRATNPTDSGGEGDEQGAQILEDRIDAEILVKNLLDCISVSEDLIEIEREGEGGFSVSTEECADNTRVSLKSRLSATPNQFSLGATAKQEIKVLVERNMPGQYPIYVYARADGQAKEKLVKLVRVRIPAEGCLDISRYEFDIFDDARNPFDGYDTAEVYNNCYNKSETAKVKFDEHDWGDAFKDGIGWGLLFGLVGGLNSSSKGCDFFTGNCDPNRSGLFGIGGSGHGENQTFNQIPAGCVEFRVPNDRGLYCENNQGIFQRRTSDGRWVAMSSDPRHAQTPATTTTPSQPPTTPPTTTPPATSPAAPLPPSSDVTSPGHAAEQLAIPTAFVALQATPGLSFITGLQGFASDPSGRPLTPTGQYGNDYGNTGYGGSGSYQSYPPSGAGQGGGGLMGGLFGGGGFLSSALMGTIAGTFWAYENQDEGEFSVNLIQRDVAIRKMELLLPGKLDQAPDQKEGKEKGTTELDFKSPVNQGGFTFTPKDDEDDDGILGGIFGGSDDDEEDFTCPTPRKELVEEGAAGTGLAGGFGELGGFNGAPAGGQGLVLNVQGGLGFGSLEQFLQNFGNAPEGKKADKQITMVDLKKASLEPREDNPALSREIRKIKFINEGKLVQKDPSNPFYRVLAVSGEKYSYLKEYEFKKAKDAKAAFEKNGGNLCVSNIAPVFQAFQLQFNSYRPVDPCELNPNGPGCGPQGPLNCQLGTKIGTTGATNAPKLRFAWSFSEIDKLTCQADEPNNAYCDATQHTIGLIDRLNEIAEFTGTHPPTTCPTEATRASTKTQDLLTNSPDVGLTKLTVRHEDKNLLTSVVAESNNGGKKMTAQLTVVAKNLVANTEENVCQKQFDLVSRSVIDCSYVPPVDARYDITATLNVALCDGCADNGTANNTIRVGVTQNANDGILACEEKRLARLPAFLEASGTGTNEIEKVSKLIKFDALLMRDGYTADFFADFDEYCKTKAFFDCPTWYTEGPMPWSRFVSDRERLMVDYPGAPNGYLEAGRYEITLDATFDQNDWKFFENGQPKAKITVRFVKKDAPSPDNPLYYVPFDGLVGIDSENGRQGYGINFAQASLEPVRINNSERQTVRTIHSPASNNTHIGVVNAKVEADFRKINVNEETRGVVLTVNRLDSTANMTLAPSYATPVLLKVTRNTAENAYAYYAVEIDNGPQAEFEHMMSWQGINTVCRDYSDAGISDTFGTGLFDTHGISTSCAALGANALASYGVEWCNVSRAGSVALQGIMFTPQGKKGVMKRVAASDTMELIGPDNRGNQIALGGVPGQRLNAFGAGNIQSIEDIIQLMREDRVCMVSGNSVSATFFWNPKPVLDALQNQAKQATRACIGETIGDQGDIQGVPAN